MELFEQRRLAPLHGDPLVVIAVIVAEHVENTMCHEQRKLVVDVSCMGRSLSICNCRTHDDVTQQQRMVVGVDLGPVGATRDTTRPRSLIDDNRVNGKRQDVGGPVLGHVDLVHLGDRRFVDEEDAELGGPAHPLGHEDVGRETSPSVDVEGEIGLFVRTENLHRAVTPDTARTSPPCKETDHARSVPAGVFVRRNDVGDDTVTHHVTFAEMHECKAIDTGEDSLEIGEATLSLGHVDLRHVTRDDDT